MGASTMETSAVIAVGLALVYGGARELLTRLRTRRRLVRASGVVVDLVEVGRFRAGSRSYAPRFRFTTGDGHVIEAVSAAGTFPGPRIGKQLTVVYDPSDPEGTAEPVGVSRVKVALAPLLVVGGAAFTAWGASRL